MPPKVSQLSKDVIRLFELFSVLPVTRVTKEAQKYVGSAAVLQGAAQLLADTGDWHRSVAVFSAHAKQPIKGNLPPTPAPVQPEGTLSSTVTSNKKDCGEDASIVESAPLSENDLVGRATSAIVRAAFELKRLGPIATPEEAATLAATQGAIVTELKKRDDVEALSQCMMNWLQRNLIATHKSNWDAREQGSEHYRYDGVRAFRDAVLPPREKGKPLLDGASEDDAWKKVVDAYPSLFARCFRDDAAVERLVTRKGERATLYAARRLLDALGAQHARSGQTRFRAPHSLSPAANRATLAEIATLWRCIAPLLRACHTARSEMRRDARQALLSSYLTAMRATAAVERIATEAQTVSAIRHSAESVCSSLLHNEAIVRAVGVDYFAEVAQQLKGVFRTPLPNAVVHCLFLTMSQTATVAFESNKDASADSTLHRYLEAPVPERWLSALELIEEGRRERAFRVTPSHLRALLGGLQSISIAQTWRQALQCAQVFETRYALLPDAATALKLMLNLEQQSWKRAFDVLRYFKQKKKSNSGSDGGKALVGQSPTGPTAATTISSAVPARVLRDLQLIAVKHAEWCTTLQIMDALKVLEERAHSHSEPKRVVGFMNVLYCVYAAATAGNVEITAHYFMELSKVPGIKGSSPFNEITVATAAVAMLDGGHYTALTRFAARMLSQLTAYDEQRPSFTNDGYFMCIAAVLLGSLLSKDYQRVTRTLEKLLLGGKGRTSGAAEQADVKAARFDVLDRCLVLFSMTSMAHLNAPIRLIFDTLGSDTVYTYYEDSDDFEGRQRKTKEHRRPLFIPPSHCQKKNAVLAEAFGAYQKQLDPSNKTTATISTLLAETMTTSGVGLEYLKTVMC